MGNLLVMDVTMLNGEVQVVANLGERTKNAKEVRLVPNVMVENFTIRMNLENFMDDEMRYFDDVLH